MAKQNTGIPTVFKGIEFRSRLEARWAAMFHELGWDFTYEPFDGNGYIPDFLVHTDDLDLIVEVKPAGTQSDWFSHRQSLIDGLTGHWAGSVLLVGVSPLTCVYSDNSLKLYGPGMIGSLAANTLTGDEASDLESMNHGWPSLDEPLCAHWHWCFRSTHISVRAGLGGHPKIDGIVEQHWANATNEVKWRGRDSR